MYQGSILVLTLLTVILVIVPMHASAQSENMMATIETKSGNFVIEFFPDVAPSHVNNFITLSQDGFYDGTVFHRVINGFMIQGGDPNTQMAELISLRGTGSFISSLIMFSSLIVFVSMAILHLIIDAGSHSSITS